MTKIMQYPDKDGNPAYASTHWRGVVGRPDMTRYYTQEEVDTLLAEHTDEKISPDGTVWVSSISNDGIITWGRKEKMSERK